LNKIEWLNSQIDSPVKSSDYYCLYDDFKETFDSELTMELFKRVVRSAFAEVNGESGNAVSVESKGSGMEVRLKTFDFQTEDDIFKASKLDPERWEISNFKFRATQNETNPYLVTTASFNKKFSELEYPLIEQVRVNIPRYFKPETSVSQAVLNISDFHAPFQDDRCGKIAVEVARDLQPSHVILNGDLLDCTDLGKYLTTPEVQHRIQESLIIVAQFIGELREVCPDSKIIYLEGNHEDRLRKVIIENVAGAVGLKRVNDLEGYDALSIPNLLCLNEIGVEWIPYKEKGYWVTDNLKFYHGEELNVSKQTKDRDYSFIIGHGHRVEIFSKSNENKEGQTEHYTAMFGCTCKLDGSVPSVKTFMDWQQSIGVVYYDEDISNPVPIYIHEGKALFNGKTYVAE